MTKNQSNKVRMYFATSRVLDENSSLFSSIEALINAHNALKSNMEVLGDYRQIQAMKSSGLTTQKQVLRGKMMQLLLRTCSALKAHALVSENIELKQKCTYNKTEFVRMSDPVFADVARLILDLALPLIDALGIYFLEQQHLDELADLIVQFKASIPGKRAASSVSKVSTKMIQEIIHKNDTLLKESLDNLMDPFEYVQPDFYRAYKNARIIVDYKGGGKVVKEKDEVSM